MKRNLEQIRAANALHACRSRTFSGREGGEVPKKLPHYIRINGILATLAFALEKKKESEGYRAAFDAIAAHLSCPEIALVRSSDAQGLLRELADADSALLRRVTAEAMNYLVYFRRFAEKGNGEE